jgi:hypothetical protein
LEINSQKFIESRNFHMVFSAAFALVAQVRLEPHFKWLSDDIFRLIIVDRCQENVDIPDSIVVSIVACHAIDPGSIPGQGAFYYMAGNATFCSDVKSLSPPCVSFLLVFKGIAVAGTARCRCKFLGLSKSSQ